MGLQRRVTRPNDTTLKRDQALREKIRLACQAVLDAPAPADGELWGNRQDEEYQRILDLRQLLPR